MGKGDDIMTMTRGRNVGSGRRKAKEPRQMDGGEELEAV